MKVIDTNHFLDVCLTEVKEELEETEQKHFNCSYPRHDDEYDENETNFSPDATNIVENTPVILMDFGSEPEGVKEEPTFVDVDQQTGIQLYSCPECEYQAQVKYYLVKHIKRCHKHLCETNMNFTCSYCHSQFHGLTSYHKHCLLEHSDKLLKVTCDICFKELSSKKSLLIHKKVAHEMYRISCIQCDKVVTSKQGLVQHIQKAHSSYNNDRDHNENKSSVNEELCNQFNCSVCNYSSPLKHNIKQHVKAAHGDQSKSKVLFPCPSCDKMFLGVPNLHRHAKEEHDMVLKLDHSCKYCGKEFNKKSNLQTHIKSVHEMIRHPCQFCAKELTTLGNKTLHVKKFHPEQFSEVNSINEQYIEI